MGKTKIMNQHPQYYKYAKLQVASDLKNENARLRGLAHGLLESTLYFLIVHGTPEDTRPTVGVNGCLVSMRLAIVPPRL